MPHSPTPDIDQQAAARATDHQADVASADMHPSAPDSGAQPLPALAASRSEAAEPLEPLTHLEHLQEAMEVVDNLMRTMAPSHSPISSNRTSTAFKSASAATGPALLDRDTSILAFNERVLFWAERKDVPLLERLRYLCIVSSNLDEWFEVRCAPYVSAAKSGGGQGSYARAGFSALMQRAQALVARQYQLYNQALIPDFHALGIRLISHGERNAAQRRWVQEYFLREVQPLLVPVGLDPSHPFPQVANKALNFIVRLGGVDAFGRANEVAIVKVPRALPRIIALPAKISGKQRLFVSISSVVRAHLAELFPGREVTEFSQFRVTRHSDLAVDEDDVSDLRMALRQGLHHRHYGQAVRLEVSSSCSAMLADLLLEQYGLPQQVLFRVKGPVNLVRQMQLIDLVDDPALLFAPWKPAWPRQLAVGQSVMAQMRRGDVLIHQPFEDFDAVLQLLREAVNDPQVLAIKQTIYRTGSDSEIMRLLAEAVARGKEVLAVLELKARFDEEANINWAEKLESRGVQVVYGVVGLKTHAKMLLITRRDKRSGQLQRYGHLSTGNYNARSARLYTDISHLTCDAAITEDMDAVFRHLSSHNQLPQLQRLVMAPFHLHSRMLELVGKAASAAAKGADARIVLKMNALTDEALIAALIQAGRKGVQIDLIVRGACQLPAQQQGCTDNIRVRSVIGRFLEHSRVFYFAWGKHEELYLSSADWMSRNMLRRVELAWPVANRKLRQRVIDECLAEYLHDDRDAWTLAGDGSYHKPTRSTDGFGAQRNLMQHYAG